MKMVVIKHFVKSIIGYGDALLFLHGKYHWSYKRKKELMWSMKPAYPAFARLYDYAVNFRFNPNYERLIHSDLKMIQRFIVRNVEKVHLQFEQSISSTEDMTWEIYFKKITTNPFYSKKTNFINLAKIFYENIIMGQNQICDEIKSKNKIKCRALGNKGFLMAIFPFVLYRGKGIQPPFLLEQDIINFYIKSWGENNDENFAQSLPGQMINKEAA